MKKGVFKLKPNAICPTCHQPCMAFKHIKLPHLNKNIK